MAPAKRFYAFEVAKVQVYGGHLSFKVLVKNLSATGAYLEMDQDEKAPQEGELIRCSLSLDSIRKKHEIDAEVVWSQDKGFGIRFLNKGEFFEKLMKTALQS